jgi:hypothetical protein
MAIRLIFNFGVSRPPAMVQGSVVHHAVRGVGIGGKALHGLGYAFQQERRLVLGRGSLRSFASLSSQTFSRAQIWIKSRPTRIHFHPAGAPVAAHPGGSPSEAPQDKSNCMRHAMVVEIPFSRAEMGIPSPALPTRAKLERPALMGIDPGAAQLSWPIGEGTVASWRRKPWQSH